VKILTVIDTLEVGTAAQAVFTLAKAALSKQLKLDVACLQLGSQNTGTMVQRLQELGTEPTVIGVQGLRDPRSVRRVADAIRSSSCQVVHAHSTYSSTLVPAAARLATRPSVCTLYSLPQQGGGRDALKERLCVAAAGRSSALIFVSEAALEQFAARYRRRPSWQVVRNGIDIETWSPGHGQLPQALRIPAHAPVVTIIGALRATKGHALAIAAWPSVLSRFPEARLVIIGEGPERATLRQQVKRAGLQDRVLFTGRVEDEQDTVDAVRASDIVILPSYGEALPMALIEASACSRPVVATDVGGVREVVSDGVNGTLIAPGHIAAIGDVVIEMLKDPERRSRMGNTGRRMVEERFDTGSWLQRLLKVYQEATSSRHSFELGTRVP